MVRVQACRWVGASSRGTSPVRLVAQGPSSDSTVSNPDSTQVEITHDAWLVKKVEMTLKLQHAKEREKMLKAQISAQRERIKLEAQEHENQRLESDIIQHEQEQVASDRDQERHDALIAEKMCLDEMLKEQKHQFELHEARLQTEFFKENKIGTGVAAERA